MAFIAKLVQGKSSKKAGKYLIYTCFLSKNHGRFDLGLLPKLAIKSIYLSIYFKPFKSFFRLSGYLAGLFLILVFKQINHGRDEEK